MDADIIISPKITNTLKTIDSLDKNTIYGPLYKYHVQKLEMGSNLHDSGYACAGFFQLFNKKSNFIYPCTSINCSYDDILFSRQFKRVHYLPLAAYHLGPTSEDGLPNVNWNGRVSPEAKLNEDIGKTIERLECQNG